VTRFRFKLDEDTVTIVLDSTDELLGTCRPDLVDTVTGETINLQDPALLLDEPRLAHWQTLALASIGITSVKPRPRSMTFGPKRKRFRPFRGS
jgi:hypothetical protein